MYAALSSQEILRVWEVALGQHPLDRALTILASAFPGVSQKQLTALSVGQRDECLFAVRERTFGSRLVSLAACPVCQGQLELMLDVADLHIAHDPDPTSLKQHVQQMTSDGYELQFRLPNSLDLAAIVGCQDIFIARNVLLHRCIVRAIHNDIEVAIEDLPETVIAALAEQMDTSDPLAALDIGLDCSECGFHLQVLFDIVSYLWTEISMKAKRLLLEVHTLARAYGWREADILSMSAVRRQLYLEMIT